MLTERYSMITLTSLTLRYTIMQEWLRQNLLGLIIGGIGISGAWYDGVANDRLITFRIDSLVQAHKLDSAGVIELRSDSLLQDQEIRLLHKKQDELKPLINALNTTLLNLNGTLISAQKDNESNQRDLQRIQTQQTQIIKDVQEIKLNLK